MPLIEFHCDKCDELFVNLYSFSQVTDNMKAPCPKCKRKIQRILFSRTLRPHFYGEGWEKPSPTKRFSTKVVSERTGNDSSIG